MTGIPSMLYWRILGAALVVGLLGFLSVIWYVGASAADQRREAKADIQLLCGVLYGMVQKSGATLGRKGTAGYFYYRQHPAELRAAKNANRDALRELPCGPPVRGPTGPVGPVGG